MNDAYYQKVELDARTMAQECPVYAPGAGAQDALYNATISGMRSAACGDRWLEAKAELAKRNILPLITAQANIPTP